ncbi:MAG: hypothetical protein ACI8XG_000590, partial [Congregibacter sp.]
NKSSVQAIAMSLLFLSLSTLIAILFRKVSVNYE